MACPPSPSVSSRRLSELLDQQQEPFSLDLYLLERGCSSAFLDAVVGGGGGACSACWPWPGTKSAGRTTVRPAARKKVSCSSSVLRLLLCKFLRGKMTPPPAKKKQLRLPDVHRHQVDLKNSVPPHRAVEGSPGKAEKEVEDDDSNKRLSPVSVLEQRSLEQSPPVHEQKALLIFRELLQAAYSPTLLDILADANCSSRSNSSKNSSTKTSTAAVARNNHAHWEEEEEGGVFEEALAEVTDIIASEMAGARAPWPGDVQTERRDVGTDIAAAVLDALVEETATELMTGVDHGFAVDTAHPHCWC